jgi:DNA-binding Lrp family transcriptional regulator
MPEETIVLKEYSCTIDISFPVVCYAKDEQDFRRIISEDFYQEHGIKLAYTEIINIKEIK